MIYPESVIRARSMIGLGTYSLGTGGYRPRDGQDLPWTPSNKHGSRCTDCAGFAISWCHRIKRRRPGFNAGGSVSGDINTDSTFEDATGKQELFTISRRPAPGDLLLFPGIRKNGKRVRIGHVGLIEEVPAEWNEELPDWAALTVIQSHGPSGRSPGVVRTNGNTWAIHDKLYGRRTVIIRVKS